MTTIPGITSIPSGKFMIEGVESTTEQAAEEIKRYLEDQIALDMNSEGAQTEVGAQLRQYRETTIDLIKQMFAKSMSIEILKDMIEGSYDKVGNVIPGTQGFTDVTSKPLYKYDDVRKKGGAYGEFIETAFLGLETNTSPLPDIREWVDEQEREIEVKATFAKKLMVGGVTVFNMLEKDRYNKDLANLVILEKMAMKMKNLLLIFTEEKESATRGRMRIGFKSIELHMILLMKKLVEIINRKDLRNKFVTINRSGKWNPRTNSQKFHIFIGLTAGGTVQKLTELYLMHHFFLNEIKANELTRKAFFATIKNLKLTMIKE